MPALDIFFTAIGLLIGNYIGYSLIQDGFWFASIPVFTVVFGGSLNLLAMMLNGGKMPVRIWHARHKFAFQYAPRHCILTKKTRAKCLCDIYRLPNKKETMVSIGDIISTFGLGLFGIVIYFTS